LNLSLALKGDFTASILLFFHRTLQELRSDSLHERKQLEISQTKSVVTDSEWLFARAAGIAIGMSGDLMKRAKVKSPPKSSLRQFSLATI
jgi:hypothetical protein